MSFRNLSNREDVLMLFLSTLIGIGYALSMGGFIPLASKIIVLFAFIVWMSINGYLLLSVICDIFLLFRGDK